jgi:hypothetical protein
MSGFHVIREFEQEIIHIPKLTLRLYTHIPTRNLVSALQTLVTRTDTTSILLIRKSLQHVNVII